MNRKRLIILACGIVIAVILLLLATTKCSSSDKDAAPTTLAQGIDTVPMLIMQVQKCSKLYTAEYRVHKIITHDDALRLKGQLMSKAFDLKVPLADRKIERNGNQITIILPDPQIVMTSSKIDQNNVKQYVGLTRAHFSDAELENYQKQGREAIIKSIPDMGIAETAQANAAKVLVPMIKQLGYEEQNITIAFRKQYSPQDWNALIKIKD